MNDAVVIHATLSAVSPAHPLSTHAEAPRAAAILLAAGAGSRFTNVRHKLLSQLDDGGPSVGARALRSALDAAIGPVVVVTGALDEAALRADPTIKRLLDEPGVMVRHNPAWADGQSTSVRAGIVAAQEIGADAVVVGLADQPFITPAAWQNVAAGLGAITVATYDGRRGNPVKLHASVWGLLPASGDEGARVLMRDRPDLVVEVPCSGSPADIDTVEDLHQWQNN